MPRHFLFEFINIQSYLFGILQQMVIIQSFLMFKQVIMHLPEFILGRSNFGCFSCMLCMRMDTIEREITKYETDFIIELLHYFFDYRISHSSIGTFIITIFYYTNGCINRASYVISSDIYRTDQFFRFIPGYFFVFYFSSPPFWTGELNSLLLPSELLLQKMFIPFKLFILLGLIKDSSNYHIS
jgi:hypothetical protein